MDVECNFLSEETLNSMTEEELNTYQEKLECNSEEDDDGEKEPKNNKDDGDDVKYNELKDKIEELENKLNENEKKEKSEYVDAIMNTNQEAFEKEELEEFSVNKLKALAREFSVTDFSGRGFPTNNEEDNDVPEAPSILLNKKKEDE